MVPDMEMWNALPTKFLSGSLTCIVPYETPLSRRITL